MFRTTLDLSSEKDTLVFTVVLIGDGSEGAPFSAVLVPGRAEIIRETIALRRASPA